MPELNSILTVMSPVGLVCGTLIDLMRDEMLFELSEDLPPGYETDWRMELRGRPETAQGRMRVTTGKSNKDGPGRFRATILNVAERDRSCFQAWLNSRNKTWLGGVIDVDDGFRPTTRMASSAETRAVLQRMEERRAISARIAAERMGSPPRVGPVATFAPSAPPVATVPAVPAAAVPLMSDAALRGLAQGPSPVRTVAAVPPPARMVAAVPAPASMEPPRPAPRPSATVAAPPPMPPVMTGEPVEQLPLRRPKAPRDPNALHRGVNLRIDEHAGHTRYVLRYVDRRRYADDWFQNISHGGLVVETPLELDVGSPVEVVLISPVGRSATLMGVVLSGSARSTCLAVLLSEQELAELRPV